MFLTKNLQSSKTAILWKPIFYHGFIHKNLSFRRPDTLRQTFPALRFAKGSDSTVYSYPSPSSPVYSNAEESSDPSVSSRLTSSFGVPPLQFSQNHFVLLNVVACVTSISALWLFLSAIPTLLALKKAAESLEKLLDVTREELPDTMAASRLSGMEISDLTMELSV